MDTNKKIVLKNARLSFPSLFEKKSFDGKGEGKFEATFLLPKSDEKTYKELIAVKDAVIKDSKLGRVGSDKICIKDGDDSDYDNEAGHWIIKASSNKRVLVLDRDRTPLTKEDEKIYAGCYVDGIITLWGQNNTYGKRVNANLLAIRYVKDGDAFGDGVVASVDDFDDLGDVEEEF